MAAAFGPERLAVILLLDRHSSDNRDPAAPRVLEAAKETVLRRRGGGCGGGARGERARRRDDHQNHMSMRKEEVGDEGGGWASRLAKFFECGAGGGPGLAAEREFGFQVQF